MREPYLLMLSNAIWNIGCWAKWVKVTDGNGMFVNDVHVPICPPSAQTTAIFHDVTCKFRLERLGWLTSRLDFPRVQHRSPCTRAARKGEAREEGKGEQEQEQGAVHLRERGRVESRSKQKTVGDNSIMHLAQPNRQR